mmetsp:Transcript_17552/g.22888  ORF Transcript_17552/g.22888 Transcript_17552/m.22888 type:complete len:352 (+) Transcript_17552:102-1157(+)
MGATESSIERYEKLIPSKESAFSIAVRDGNFDIVIQNLLQEEPVINFIDPKDVQAALNAGNYLMIELILSNLNRVSFPIYDDDVDDEDYDAFINQRTHPANIYAYHAIRKRDLKRLEQITQASLDNGIQKWQGLNFSHLLAASDNEEIFQLILNRIQPENEHFFHEFEFFSERAPIASLLKKKKYKTATHLIQMDMRNRNRLSNNYHIFQDMFLLLASFIDNDSEIEKEHLRHLMIHGVDFEILLHSGKERIAEIAEDDEGKFKKYIKDIIKMNKEVIEEYQNSADFFAYLNKLKNKRCIDPQCKSSPFFERRLHEYILSKKNELPHDLVLSINNFNHAEIKHISHFPENY